MITESADEAGPIVQVSDLRFAWRRSTTVLDVSAFEVGRGERVFLKGSSGSGKSTLLGLIAGVLTPASGEVIVDGVAIGRLSGARRDAFRAERLGVIFQLFNLLPYLDVIENVALPCRFSSARRARAAAKSGSIRSESERLLARLDLSDPMLLTRPVGALSVGQQQRVAAARALIGAPKLIIADEPTSALDADARDSFVSLLIEETAASGSALLFVSHDAGLAQHFDRRIDLVEINRALAGASA